MQCLLGAAAERAVPPLIVFLRNEKLLNAQWRKHHILNQNGANIAGWRCDSGSFEGLHWQLMSEGKQDVSVVSAMYDW
jgi:hypothetical protein